MEKKLCTVAPIELQINGFAFFNHGKTGKTIYAAIELTTQTNLWFKLLMGEMGIKVKAFVPHITVAKNIPVSSFNKLWPKFETCKYAETFKVNSLTVLKRETYVEYCEWRMYKELFFANKMPIF